LLVKTKLYIRKELALVDPSRAVLYTVVLLEESERHILNKLRERNLTLDTWVTLNAFVEFTHKKDHKEPLLLEDFSEREAAKFIM